MKPWVISKGKLLLLLDMLANRSGHNFPKLDYVWMCTYMYIAKGNRVHSAEGRSV